MWLKHLCQSINISRVIFSVNRLTETASNDNLLIVSKRTLRENLGGRDRFAPVEMEF